jgi:hypothetical protein
MTRFADVLKKAGNSLDVPEHSRRQILLEMASDLDDSYRHFLGQGFEETEAARRAEEAFGTSDEAIRLLARVHRSHLGNFSDRISQQIGTLWAKTLMVVLLLFEILLALRIISDPSFFVHPSPFLWPIAVIALAAFLFTAWKLAQIYSRQGFDVRRLRIGLAIPLFFSGASLAIAGWGFLFHLQRFFRLNADGAPEALFLKGRLTHVRHTRDRWGSTDVRGTWQSPEGSRRWHHIQ